MKLKSHKFIQLGNANVTGEELKAYSGFDGDVLHVASSAWSEEELRSEGILPSDILRTICITDDLTALAPAGFSRVGYDVGYFESAWNKYSLVPNYFLPRHGTFSLNRHHLFSDELLARQCAAQWHLEDPEGKETLEEGEQITVYKVFVL